MTPEQPANHPTRGRRMGIDVGEVRIGVAMSDPDGLIATPVETIVRTDHADGGISRLRYLMGEYDVQIVYIGLPFLLSGHEGAAASAVRSFTESLVHVQDELEYRFIDERLSTVAAHNALRQAGIATKRHRPVVDQQAAVQILQGALESERLKGSRAGQDVHDGREV